MSEYKLEVPQKVRDKVLARIDQKRVAELCSQLIQLNSMVENESAEVEMADFVAGYLKDLGLKVRKVDFPEDMESIPGVSAGSHPQVIAERKGSGRGVRLMIGGHLDTEPAVNPELWTHDPYSGHIDWEEGFVYGLGTVNMKQSLASFMEAVRAVVTSGVELKGDLLFAGWSQENVGLIGSKYLAHNWSELDLGPLPDMVFDGEQTDCSVWSTNMGMALFRITTHGRLGHVSSRYTHHPSYDGFRQVNALDKMVKIINELKDVRKNFRYERGHFLGDPVISLGKVETKVPGAGTRACLGVEECSMYVDLRFPPGADKESLKQDIERIIYNLSIEDPEMKAEVESFPGPMGLEVDQPILPDPDLPLLKVLKTAHKEVFGEDLIVDSETSGTTTHRVVDWTRYAGSDLISFYSVGVPGLNYGAGVVPVTPDEKVSIQQLADHCRVSALTIMEICGVAG